MESAVLEGALPAKVHRISIEEIAKIVGLFALLCYGSGFLIASLHDSAYGFSETNPLRPKTLCAGAWFFVYVSLPIATVLEIRHLRVLSKSKFGKRPSFAVLLYCLSGWMLGSLFQLLYESGDELRGKTHATTVWQFFLLPIVVSAFIAAAFKFRIPESIGLGFSACMVAFIGLLGLKDAFVLHRGSAASTAIWFVLLALVIHSEMRSRNWRIALGNWRMIIAYFLGALIGFSTLYYPHISSSWGGPAPVPITIRFSKDAATSPGKDMDVLLLDESDAGFYVLGDGDQKATFIPRSAIGAVYYARQPQGALLKDRQ